ncbi:sigma factor-like helix-turn-helix DNA-binding protein [Polymorphospora sp. NPDC051019]|uniref:RNA polymerase sigma factor n=1 Tax=Polymorphospora sp. NPDC051019 TaxID=3155725 RepID=UPI0034454886
MEALAADPAADQTDPVPEVVGRPGRTGEFADFYRSHLGKVYRALALTLGNDDLAREAADEAMTRAYAHWGRVSGLDNPGGWVFRVGLNWATSWWRKARREQVRLDDWLHPRTAGPDPVALAARAAVERLPLKQRGVVVCRVLLELSTAETAATLGISEGTVKSRLSRALTTLRQALEE